MDMTGYRMAGDVCVMCLTVSIALLVAYAVVNKHWRWMLARSLKISLKLIPAVFIRSILQKIPRLDGAIKCLLRKTLIAWTTTAPIKLRFRNVDTRVWKLAIELYPDIFVMHVSSMIEAMDEDMVKETLNAIQYKLAELLNMISLDSLCQIKPLMLLILSKMDRWSLFRLMKAVKSDGLRNCIRVNEIIEMVMEKADKWMLEWLSIRLDSMSQYDPEHLKGIASRLKHNKGKMTERDGLRLGILFGDNESLMSIMSDLTAKSKLHEDIESLADSDCNLIQYAAENGSWSTLQAFLHFYPVQEDREKLISARDDCGNNTLHYAARGPLQQDVALLYDLIGCDARDELILTKNNEYQTPVQVAIISQAYLFVKVTLEYVSNDKRDRLIEETHFNIRAPLLLPEYRSLYSSVLASVSQRQKHAVKHKMAYNELLRYDTTSSLKLDLFRMPKKRHLLHKKRFLCNWTDLHDLMMVSEVEFIVRLDRYRDDGQEAQVTSVLCIEDCNGNTMLHLAFMLRYLKLLHHIYNYFHLDLETMLYKRNQDGLTPVDMIWCQSDLFKRYVGYETFHYLCRRGNSSTAYIVHKLVNFFSRAYLIPNPVQGFTDCDYTGAALIISNSFDGWPEEQRRDGWQQEQYFVQFMMDALRVKVSIQNNVPAQAVVHIIRRFCKKSTGAPIVYIFIMTHGCDSVYICGCDYRKLSIQDVINEMGSKYLTYIPKVMFVQACRGDLVSSLDDVAGYCALDASQQSDIPNLTQRILYDPYMPKCHLLVPEESRMNKMQQPEEEALECVVGQGVHGGWQMNQNGLQRIASEPTYPQYPIAQQAGLEIPFPDFLLCLSTLSGYRSVRGEFMKLLAECSLLMMTEGKTLSETLNEVNFRLRKTTGQHLYIISTLNTVRLT